MNRIDPQYILDYYKKAPRRVGRRPGPMPVYNPSWTLSTSQNGLGDTLMLTDLPRAASKAGAYCRVFSRSPFFEPLRAHVPYPIEEPGNEWVIWDWTYHHYDCGGGHTIQCIQRMFGLPISVKPSACVELNPKPAKRKLCVLHFEPGQAVEFQRKVIHPRARMIYDSTFETLCHFILSKPDYEFVVIGSPLHHFIGMPPFSDNVSLASLDSRPLPETIKLIAQAEYFIGIMSGPMHAATALNCKCIVIINFPDPKQIVLPALHHQGIEEECWFYPQNVHLHQDLGALLVPKFSRASLEAAWDGQVYPYWSDEYCKLITK